MNRKYLRMDIESDGKKIPNLIRALVVYEENGKLYNNYTIGRSILSELEAFAAQENVSLGDLIVDKTKVNFQITPFAKKFKPYITGYNFDLPAYEISGCEKLLYELMEKQREQKFAKLPKFKSVVKVVVFSGLILAVGNHVNYKIQETNALKNQYVILSPYSIKKEISPDMVYLLNDYEKFDMIISNIAQKNWEVLKENTSIEDIENFFDYLDKINMKSSEYITGRLNGDHTAKPMYTTQFEEYFKDSPNDYYAIRYINKCYYDIVSNFGSEVKAQTAIEKYLNFVIDNSNCTEHDSNGNIMFIRYVAMDPMAQYIINSQMINIIRACNAQYSYKAYGYNWLTKGEIISKIEDELSKNHDAVLRSIGINERRKK